MRVLGVLKGCSEGIKPDLFESVDIALQELILASLSTTIRPEFKDKSANEAYSILSARYSNSGVTAYTTLSVKLSLLRQAPEQTIQDHISKFDSLRAQFKSSEDQIGLDPLIEIFVTGLQPQFSREAFLELARQNNVPDFEGLKQALIRVSIFEKNQREFRRPNAPKPVVRQNERNERNERNFSSEKGARPVYTHCGYTGHLVDGCWLKYPEKRPSQGPVDQNRPRYRGSTEKEVVSSQSTARSAVNACVLQENSWLLDSATSFYMINSQEILVNITPIEPKKVRVSNGNELITIEKGSIYLENGVKLLDVYFVHGLNMNLLSVDALLIDNWIISFKAEQQRRAILTKNRLEISILSKNEVFQVEQAELAKSSKIESQKGVPKLSEQLIHQRIGHLNSEFIRQLPEALGRQFELKYEKKEFCEPCILGKQRRRSNREPATTPKAVRPGQRIHVNLCEEGYTFAFKEAQIAENFDELSISEGEAKFFIIITDEFSRFRRTIPLKRKNEAEKAIREWILELNAKDYKIKVIRKNEGSEFKSRNFTK